MSEVEIFSIITSIITGITTLGGVFLGYYISRKVELEWRAKECYFKYIVPLQNSLEDLVVALGSWSIIAEKYADVPEDALDEKQKREIEIANENVDEQSLKLTKVLETFQLSEARQVLRSIRPDIEELITTLTHVMTTIIKHPNLQAPRKTILAPDKFPLSLSLGIDFKKLKSKLEEITLNDFIKAYKRIFG